MGSCSSTNSGKHLQPPKEGFPHTGISQYANPGGVYHWLMVSSGCDSYVWGWGDWWTCKPGCGCGFGHPMPWVTANAPLAQALQLLLQLHSLVVGGSVGSDVHEDMILIQLEGRLSSRTSTSVNEVRGSMAHQNSSMLSTSWQDMPGIGGWAFSTHYWRALALARVFWGCFRQ